MTESSETQDPLAEDTAGRIKVSVRVIGDALDPAEVSRLMGAEPTLAARKGERVNPGRRDSILATGVWVLSAERVAGWPLDEAIGTLLARLPADPAVWRSLAERFHVDVLCGMFMGRDNEPVELRAETLALLAARGLPLGLDVYAPPPGVEGALAAPPR